MHLFSGDLVIRLLQRYFPNYKALLINLYELVIINAVGLALIGAFPLSLQISVADQSKLEELFKRMPGSEARLAFMDAAKDFCNEARITDNFIQEYVAATAIDL